jgi:mono/diheme cytochrome c family protein
MKHLFATALLAAASAGAGASVGTSGMTLDPFFQVQPVQYDGSLPSATVLRTDSASWLSGVTRTLQISPVLGQPGQISMQLGANDVLLMRGSGPQVFAGTLSYGLDAPMNLDLSSQGGIVLDYRFSTPHKLTVYAMSDGAAGESRPGSALTVDIGTVFHGTVLLPFSAFSINSASGLGVDWGSLDTLSLAFSSSSAAGFEAALDGITTVPLPVPEPAAWAMWALGLGLLVSRSLALAGVVAGASAGATTAPEQSLLERGRYMVVTGQCNNCHTSGYSASQGTLPEARWLLGDARGRAEPGGTVYATNLRLLVQDLSVEQWLALVQGSRARAPMPWWNLRQTSEADLRAMYAYIRSLGPAGEPAPAFRPAAAP